jgi:hypothetical protein
LIDYGAYHYFVEIYFADAAVGFFTIPAHAIFVLHHFYCQKKASLP